MSDEQVMPSKDVRWVHLDGDMWVWADAVSWSYGDETVEGWGFAKIAGEEYEVIWSYDGDGYTQMGDSEIDRYYRLQVKSNEKGV